MARKKKLPPVEFEALLQRILAAADVPLAEMVFEPGELDFDLLDVDLVESQAIDSLSRPPAAPAAKAPETPVSMYKTHSILIRVPERVILAFKHEAKRTGGHYQTLMNKSLKTTADKLV